MPVLFIAKQRTGRKRGSCSLLADSNQTFACRFMSFALLLGLLANRLFGFCQADPVVGLFIGAWLFERVFKPGEGKLCSC